jgi:hypothetical protein
MLDLGTAVLAVVFYLTGNYGWALPVIALSIVSGVGVVVMALINPDWYSHRRAQAGLEIDYFNSRKGIGSLIVTKAIIVALLLWAARYIAEKGGYL